MARFLNFDGGRGRGDGMLGSRANPDLTSIVFEPFLAPFENRHYVRNRCLTDAQRDFVI